MACTKCSEKFCLDNEAGIIFFISEFDELTNKTVQFLEKLSLNPENFNGLVSVNTQNVKNFFFENLDAIKSTYNQLELEDIKVFITDDKIAFNFQSILLAKPLQR